MRRALFRNRDLVLMTAGFACLLLAGCYEIPPELPDDDSSPATSPPTPVYDPDPFAPENRWFERAFKLVRPDSAASEQRVESRSARRPSSGTAEPLPSVDELEIVDLAELTALSEAVLEEPLWESVLEEPLWESPAPGSVGETLEDCREGVARLIFHCDVLALQAALAAREAPAALPAQRDRRSGAATRLDSELQKALERLSFRLFDELPEGVDGACWIQPIRPTRRWPVVRVDLPLGLLPSAQDLRWTQVLRAKDSQGKQASALLRLRVSRDYGGGFSLLSIASECWLLEREGERVTATVWRFDRAAWLAGEDPWRRLAPQEEFSIRDPLVVNGEWLTGTTESLCLGCHAGGRESPRVPRASADHEAQLARVREILDKETTNDES